MAGRATKRPRSTTGINDAWTTDAHRCHVESTVEGRQYNRDLVNTLDAQTIATLLTNAANIYPNVSKAIKNEVDRRAAKSLSEVIDFDHHSKTVWYALNIEYRKLSSSRAYERSGDVSNTIDDCIETIGEQFEGAASFGTKKNALETLRKIAKSICLSNNTIGHEVRIDFGHGGRLTALMSKIVQTMGDSEKNELRWWYDSKLVELHEIAESYCIFEELTDVIDSFRARENEIHDDAEEELNLNGDSRVINKPHGEIPRQTDALGVVGNEGMVGRDRSIVSNVNSSDQRSKWLGIVTA